MDESAARRNFLRDEFHRLTLQATVQRASVYIRGVPERDRSSFQSGLRRALDNLAPEYAKSVREERHCDNIARLADSLSAQHGLILAGGRFRIGPAQKAVNLFLKYLWCTGDIPTPPHCPFDARIILLLPPVDRINWTTMDSVDSYRRLVAAARRLAGKQSLAEWELHAYGLLSPAAERAT